ncbi:MAG: sigma-54-dependent Fis family transcriptional regulator [Ignavibacteriae bacterium]|nr:sigma-54-dependent Fis family transcriptional regulator [Ignavibacteriota bacterium]NOG99756.1 sigma-54-dependent Fis family transcriptional regulator [Ignavibacteriota bacterium]
MAKIIVVDDDESIRQTICNYLKREKYETSSAADGVEGLELIKRISPDLVISDIRMPGLNGLELMKRVKESKPGTHFILMTAYDDMDITIEAMKKGAYDYLEKPIEIEKLTIAINRALENKKLSDKLKTVIESKDDSEKNKNTIIGKAPVMRSIFKKIGQVADNRVTTLIQGESGTGKELVARAIHFSGVTKGYPFVAVNCTALTETLLESELFGHMKGSFTGSIKDKKGKFEIAGEGTLFLDEISEISQNLQVKLLRIIQEKEFERVGGESTIPMKARIIAATNKNIEKMVQDGTFREDLFYRLNVLTINIPPLRDRKEDIPILVNHFLNKINKELHKKVNKIPNNVMEILKNHNWIGNVRELENTLMQAIVLSSGDVLEKENILLRENESIHSEFDDIKSFTLADIEKRHIEKMLTSVKWEKPLAAKYLGISLPTLYSKIENYGIEKP